MNGQVDCKEIQSTAEGQGKDNTSEKGELAGAEQLTMIDFSTPWEPDLEKGGAGGKCLSGGQTAEWRRRAAAYRSLHSMCASRAGGDREMCVHEQEEMVPAEVSRGEVCELTRRVASN